MIAMKILVYQRSIGKMVILVTVILGLNNGHFGKNNGHFGKNNGHFGAIYNGHFGITTVILVKK